MKKLFVIALWILCCFLLSHPVAFAQTKGGTFSKELDKTVAELNYHALVIGINKYDYGIPDLKTSVNDAKATRDILIKKYGFTPENVIEIYNSKATRRKILRTFRELSISMKSSDALVIYFAGHGIEDPATEFGYWIPSDGKPNQYETFVANSDIRAYLKAIKAQHIFLVSDSCFSGKLLAQRAIPGEIDERFYAQKAKKRSRVVLTSGGNEPVMDIGKSGHSIFGYFFLQILNENDKPYLIPTQIFAEIGPLVGNNAPQTPQWGSLRLAMDEGGEIVLVNRQFRQVERRDLMGSAVSPSIAYLTVVTNPWVDIYIDGKAYGPSPRFEIEIEPGKHKVRLVNGRFGVDRSFTVDLKVKQRIKIGPRVDDVWK